MASQLKFESAFEQAKRYLAQGHGKSFVINKLVEDGYTEDLVDLVFQKLEKEERRGKQEAWKKLGLGFLIFIVAAFFMIVVSGYWIYNQILGYVGLAAMIYGFIIMAKGLGYLLDIRQSAFFKSWNIFPGMFSKGKSEDKKLKRN